MLDVNYYGSFQENALLKTAYECATNIKKALLDDIIRHPAPYQRKIVMKAR